jgi:predicted ATP-grasp superfamily ATP-dependent carboligase
MPEKNPRVQGIVDSKEFATEDNGMSMTIGNEDYDEREDESLMEREMKNGNSKAT